MKWSQIKRVISMTLSVLMVLALLPTSTLAEETAAPVETSAPVETQNIAEEVTPAAEETAPAAEATSAPAGEATPAPEGTAESTPMPSESPATDVIPEGPQTFVVNFVIDGETKWDLQQTVAIGEMAQAPSIPDVPASEEYVGQVFLYWYAHKDEAYHFDTPVNANLTLYAQFGVPEEAPQPAEEPIIVDEGGMLAAFSMAGGILPESTPLWTYTFVVGSTTVATKIVANGDTMDAPEVPAAPAGQKFVGWFTADNAEFNSFGTQTVAADGATTLTAKFETAYYVFFYNQFGSVTETRTPDASNSVSTDGVTSLKVGSDEALVGWSLTPGGTTDVGASVTVNNANVSLYPIIKKVVWITFNSVDGTYISPMYIMPNTALTLSAVNTYVASQNGGSSTIVKPGYAFASWSGFTFGNTPTGSVTLTANWTPNTNTPYKLVYWIENPDDTGYSFEKSVNKTGTTAAVIAPTAAETAATNLNASYAQYFNNGTYTAGQTIKGDGSSILNIYHTRKTYTLTYKNGNNTIYNQTYKYDQNISAVWNVPAILNLSNQGYVWQSSLTNDFYSFLMKMPGSNLTMTATQWQGNTYTWTYYLETLDGTAATAPAGSTTTTSNGITYYKMKTVTIKGGNIWLTYDEDYFPITGFYQRDSKVPDFTQNGTVFSASLFYRRSSYTLTFINGDTSSTTAAIKFEAPISSFNYSPNRPTGVPSSFAFGGWFTTEASLPGTEFSWTQTMPAKNIVLYSKWASPAFTGVAHSVAYGSSGGTTVDLGSIPYGGTISASALADAQTAANANKPHPSDTFGGWLIMKNGSLILFNASMQIYENVVLYPVWLSTLNFKVTYNLGEASGTAPVDSLTYAPGGQAQVHSYAPASVTPPADKVFLGWRSSADSKIYYPNSKITVTDDTTLTAVWAYSSVQVTITYDGNGGKTSDNATTFTGGAVNNTYHTVQSNSFLYTGKVFVGWNTAANGSGTMYNPGDSVLLGVSVATAPGTLYAIWDDQTFGVSVTANPAAGVLTKSGAGTYVYGANATITWTYAPGYEVTSVTDNGTTLPSAAYAGNSYTLSGIAADHAIVINTRMTLFNLTYNGNGGTVGGNASYSATKTMGTSFAVDANTFTRAGYYFLGWSTSSTASVADPAYAPGTSVTMPSNDLTLYAVWAAKTALTLTANSATLNYNGSARSVSGITPSVSGLTIENTTAGASGTNPGVYATSFANQAGLVLKSGGVDVTERYTVSWVDGSLTINPQVTYRASADGSLIGTEWVAYGTGDATYNVTPPQSITVSGANYYWLGTYNPATADNLTANTTIYATYTQNKTLVITADSASYLYNGTTRSVTTGTVNVSGVTVTGYTVSGSGTNVGAYTTSVTLGAVKIMNGATDVTYQYDVSTVNGTLTINPADTTATSSGYTGTYDNLPHGITVTPTISGSTVKYSLTNSTNPSDYSATMPTATDATAGTKVYFVVTNPNYNPVFGNQTVTINKRVVALTTSTASKMYDGTALTSAAWDYDTTGNDGFVSGQGFATATANGTITNVGSTDNTFAYTLSAATKADNYTINVTKGKLTITASDALSISATDVTKKYDGTAYGVAASANVPSGTTVLYSETYSANPANYTLTTSPKATHVGESKTVYFVATNANYAPAFGSAKVTITPREITLTAASETRAYNGNALTNATVTATGDSFLGGEGFETQPTASGTITDVGSVANTVVAGTLNASTLASDYSFTSLSGALTVTKAALTVQADDQQIAYPANRPATGTLTYTLVSGAISGETPAYNGALGYDASLATDPLSPKTYANAIVGGTLALKNNDTFKAANYALTVLPGDLKVVNGDFVVDLNGGSWTYNGNPHTTTITGTNPTDTVEYFVPNGTGGWTSTGSTPPSVTNVADGPLTVKVVVTRPGYDPAEDTAILTINPADTTANSSGYTGTYDNLPHGITVTPTIPGSTVKYSRTNSTNPADYSATMPTATDATAGTKVYFVVTNPNYNPVFGNQTVIINKRVVALTTSTASKMYDGSALTSVAWDYDTTGNDGFVAGQGFATATANGTITNVGSADNTFGYTLSGATKADNYTIDVTKGKLTVTASDALTVSATDVTKKYDGTAYGVAASANVPTGTTVLYSETYSANPASYTLTTSPKATHVGESKTVYFVATNANYAPAFGNAKVTITPREITLTAASDTRAYNGSALTNATVTATGDSFLSGEGFETQPTASGTITDVGSVTNAVVAGTLNASTLASDYSFTSVPGALTVTKAALTVQADDQQIAYPANRPANGTLTYTLVSGAISGETPAYNGALGYDASLATDPLSPKTYTNAIVGGTLALKNNDTFKAANYALTVLPGDLKVVNGDFVVDLTGGSWTYNGNPHTTTITGTNPTDTVEYFVPNGTGGWTSTGSTPPSVTNVSDGPLTVKVVVTRPGYDPAEDTAILTINPADTTANSSGYTGTYDNLPHGITVTPTISGSTVKYSRTNSTNPADYSATMPTATDATAGTKVYFVVTNPNYNPVFGNQTVTINKRVVALTTSTASKMYDGSALTSAAWDYDTTGNDGFVAGQGFATATANGTITNVGSTDNTFAYTLSGATKADNYTIDVTKGKLTITASDALSVSATDVTKKYDGTAYGVAASANVPSGTTVLYSETYSANPASYTLTTSPKATHVGESKTVYFVATNANYAPAFGNAKVTITPREITLTAASDTRAYNGSALTNATVTATGDSFLGGEGFETQPTASGTITDVGSATNAVVAGTLNASTIASDYSFTSVPGVLTVTKAALTVQADDQQIAYPANRPANGTLTYTLVSGAIPGETPAYNGALGYDASLATDPLSPKTYTNAIVGGTLALKNNDTFKAANYALTVLPGDLKVVNGDFVVDLTGGSWTYNGNPHTTTITGTNPTDTVEYFVPNGTGGWTSTGSTPPSVTNVSDGPLTVKVVVTRPGYDPAEDTAILTINPADTTATSSGYTGTYDNLPHGITVTPTISGSTVKYSLTNSTNPSDYSATMPTATDATAGTKVYFVVTNPNYNPVFGNQEIFINKRVVALTTSTASKMYDGSALTSVAWDYDTTGNDGFVAGQGFATATADGTITNVGSTDNTFAYTLSAATKADNYTIDVTKGKLTITASDALSVSATDVTKKYDGTAYGVAASANVPTGTTVLYSETYSANPANYTLTTSPKATHVGESKTVYFVATNANYAPAFGNAKVTITPRELSVITASATRTYNGTALTATGWNLDPAKDGFVGSEGFATPATTGSVTNVGTAQNGFGYTLKSNTNAADYTIGVVPGMLEVTPRLVLIAATDTGKNFGSADPAFDYTVLTGTIGGATYEPILPADLAGVTVKVNRTGSDSAVGTYPGVLVPDVTATAAVRGNYSFATQDGDLTINPQVVYKLNTTDTVTGFPQTQWFDFGKDATIANADGVKRPGYRLTGWEDATTGDPITLGGTIPAISENRTLNAVWEIALYNVTYDANTLDPVDYMPSNITGKTYNTSITIAEKAPYLSGYDFLYWKTTGIDGTEMHFGPNNGFTMPDNDVVLTAVWVARTSPIYYHANGGNGGTVEGARVFTDAVATVSGNMFSRPGYRFLGWSEKSATAGVSRQPGDTFYMPPRQVNFYAQWEKLTYSVTYIVSGGTGDLNGNTPYAVYTGLGYGDAMPVPANPTLNGYAFDGWSTAIPATVPEGGLVIYGTMSIKGLDKEPEVVPENQTPLAGGPVWALLNLILTIATALASILMLIGLIGKKKEEKDGVVVNETEKHPFTRVLTLLPGIGAIIAFILTENMRNPMVFTDRWTLLMVIIALVQLVLVIFGAKKEKEKEVEQFDTTPKAE